MESHLNNIKPEQTLPEGTASLGDRQPAALDLIHSQDLREVIFNESTDALFLVDSSSLLTFDCNQRAVELFEASSKQELIGIEGQTLQKYQFTPEELDNIVEEINQQGKWGREIEYVTRQGREFWGNLAVKVIYVGGQAINLVRITDISERKHTEQALRESELRFRGIFNQMFQFIGLLSTDGTLLEANETALNFGGLQLSEVQGLPFWEAYWWKTSPETQSQLRQAIAQAAQGEFVRYEVEVQGANHQTIIIDFSIRPVFDASGQVALLIPEGRDITKHKQAEKELELQAVIARNMAKGICLVRIEDGIIVYANPKFEQMLGYDVDELNNQHISIINYESDQISAREINQKITQSVMQYGEATYKVQNVKKDGTLIWCRATTSRFVHPDYGNVMVAVQQDITEQKQMEDQLKASLQEKEVLLKEIHHRVKNNLQIVDGLLKMQSRRITNAEALSALQDSQSRIASIALIHEKLYSSNELANIDFARYISELTASLFESYNIGSNPVNLSIEVSPISLEIETAIPCGLIINELVSNSLKHAFPQEQAGEIQIKFHQSNDSALVLIVQDNGIGLPENLDIQKTRSIGMTLIQGLVDQLEGTLEIERKQGTIFRISFPVLVSQTKR
jgi:PAS domain S-box-containing protein